MHHVCMAKLSQQIAEQQEIERPTRTQRVLAKQEEIAEQKRIAQEQREYSQAREKLSNATYENYEEVYYSIDPKYRENFLSPLELKQTEGYQKYAEEKAKQEEIKKWERYFSAYDKSRRGKPFVLGLDPTNEEVYMYGQVRKAVKGEPSIVPQYVTDYLKQGLTTDFGTQQKVFGIDRGETVTITTKDKATGEIKTQEIYQRTAEGQLLYGKITQADIEKAQKEAGEKAYQEFLKQYPEVALEKTEEVKTTPDTRKWYEKSIDELLIQPTRTKVGEGFSYLTGKAKQGLDIADKYVRWDFQLTGSPNFPKVKLISFGKQGEDELNVDEKIEELQEKILEKSFDVKEAEIEKQLGVGYKEFKESKEEKAQQDVTSLFYRSEVGREVFLTAKDEAEVQKAFEEYKETTEYKNYQKQFEKTYQSDLKTLLDEVPYATKLKGTGAGLKMAGLSFGSLGLSLIKSPTRAGLTVGAIYGGSVLYSSLPASTLVGIDVAFGTVGAIKTFAPSSTIEERGSGALMLGIAGTSLSLKGIKYLRQPTVKTVKIQAPKQTLKASEVIGKDIKVITEKGFVNKVIYGNQKLSQVGIAGRRTIVSTKWRDILGLEPIYKGIPTAQRGTTYVLQSFRGTTYYSTKSAYQKAFDLLTKRGGLTNYQASQTLRYIQPRVIEQYLSKGVLTIKGGKAVGEFTYLTKQPVITVNEALGIKTRGARTIKDFYEVERKLINLKSGGTVVIEDKIRTSLFLKRGSSPLDFKDFQFSRGILVGKSTDLKKGYDILRTDVEGLKAFKEIQYRDIAGISLTKDIFPSDKVLKLDIGRTKLINKLIDLRVKGYGVKVSATKKTPLSKTFAVEKVIEKQLKVESVKDIIKKATGSQSQTLKQAQDILKQPVATPKISTDLKAFTDIEAKLGIGIKGIQAQSLLPILLVKQGLKQDLKMQTDLKLDLGLRQEIKQEILIKQAVKQQVAQKSALRQATLSDAILTKIGFPTATSIKSPVIDIRPPKVLPIAFYLPSTRGGGGKKRKSRGIQEFAFLPDFTARALGLEAETITEAQAKKRLKKILTGLELRRSVKVKF